MDNKTKIQNCVFHTHTENSLKDSALKVETLCKVASEYGAKAVALTDHGTLMGIEPFLKACKEYNLKPIPGVEAYVAGANDLQETFLSEGPEENSENPNPPLYAKQVTYRNHLVIVAKDHIGYHAISKAVTESNDNMDSKKYPLMDSRILNKYFGPGSEGYDHVIASSACMAGVLSSILLKNQKIEKSIEKLKEKRNKYYNPNSPQYIKNKAEEKRLEEEIEKLNEEKKELEPISKRPFTKKEKRVKTLEGKPDSIEEYNEAKALLEAEKAETEAAKVRLEAIKSEIAILKGKHRTVKSRNKEEEDQHSKWFTIDEQITNLQESISDEKTLYEETKEAAKFYSNLFGDGNFYCELQNHRIPEEIYVMPIIAKIAKELNLPVIAANDVHIATNSPDEIKGRQIMRSLRFEKWEEATDSDKELYVKTDEELSSILSEILPAEIVKEAMDNLGVITEKCNYVYEGGTHYPQFISEIPGETADEALKRTAYEGIKWRYPNAEDWTEEHQKRVDYELDVIAKMGYSDYHCIVYDFLNYGRLLGKIDLNDPRYKADPYNIPLLEKLAEGNVGCSIGPGRGSAVGSLVCYLTGITSIDPIKYNLIFERFLNVERVSMPDIDSDFRPDVRELALEYVKYKYGEESVTCIMTKGTMAARAAVRNCGRMYGLEKYDDPKAFLALSDEIAKSIPKEPGIKFKDCEKDLKDKYADNEDALTIIHYAEILEGTFINVGQHAAGVIIADNTDVRNYVPLMYNAKGEQWVTQCEKDFCEGLNLLKMDFLGLKNLGFINETIRLVQERHGINIDIEQVPFEREVFDEIYAKGHTNSIFQFESNGMKQMLRQFKPENIEDIILLVAAYRPGPMQYLDSIISVKHGRKEPDYVIPEMASVLGNTYCYPVYQEQIMTIFNKFAGFSLGESDIIRRYMSKKKTDKFMAYKDKFVEGMISRGGNPRKVEDFWNQLVEFSKYAFNRSHAAAYAFVSYYTAWLKYHYPEEYLTAVMNATAFEKLGGLITDCKNFGINVLPPDINASENAFSINENGIIYGLSKVKSVAATAEPIIRERRMNGPFRSFSDFILRTRAKKNAVEALIDAGAFDAFTNSRTALKDSLEEYGKIAKKIKEKEDILEEFADAELMPENTTEEKKAKKSAITRFKNAEKALNLLNEQFENVIVNIDGDEDVMERLTKEKEVTGSFISSHPMDFYKSPQELKCTPINELNPIEKISIVGLISNLRIVNRKKDNKQMAFFTLEDQTGTIDVCVFANEYAVCKDYIYENAVVKITGKCEEIEDEFNEDTKLNFIAKDFEFVKENKPYITLYVNNIMEWTDTIYDIIRPYLDNIGCPLRVYDKLTGQFRNSDLLVSKSILRNPKLETSI